MIATTTKPAGVMDASYAGARQDKPPLGFRLRARAKIVVDAVRRFDPPSPVRLLDIGAAEGRTLVRMATRLGPGAHVGVEYDPSLRMAHPPLPSNVTLIGGDATSLPAELASNSFSVVSLLAILEHLCDPRAALREARRVLRPGGLVVATCPTPFWDRVAGRLRLVNDDHHEDRIDLARLKALVESTGFDVLEARRFMWAPIAVLPYAHIPVSQRFAGWVDRMVDSCPVVRGLCVNAYVVARRPRSDPPS